MRGVDLTEVDNHFVVRFHCKHRGTEAVFNVHAEAWPGDTALDEAPGWHVVQDILLPGEPEVPVDGEIRMRINDVDQARRGLAAWRLRWSDADGRDWCVDQQDEPPRRFLGGPPRPARR